MHHSNKSSALASIKAPVNIAVPEACIIGLIAALGAVALKTGVGIVGTLRVHLGGISPSTLPMIGLLGGVLVGFLIQYVDKGLAGSGIPQTKAALLGYPVALNFKSAVLKLISCIISLGSGLALGREGPTVQVAAGLSSTFSNLRKTSPAHNAQLIAAGAGAGLAAAFNTPLAGVLFVLEELIKKMSGFAVGTTVVACFVASVTSRLVGVHSLDINLSELFPKATFEFRDIPFMVVLGMLTGICGAIFNKSIIAALTLNRSVFKLPPVVSSGLAGLLTGTAVMLLPDMFSNYAGLREMTLQSDTSNNLIAGVLAFQFLLAVLAYGSGAPGGLFAPSLTMGACLGHLVAVMEKHLIHSGDIGTMSVVGMGAFFCAVARVPITAVVIVFEMTADFNLVLPLMVCCMVSYLVAEQIDPGSIYDQLLVWSGILLDERDDEGVLSNLRAHEVMTKQVKSIPLAADLADVKVMFETSNHRGFPVVDPTGKVVGIVARPDLLSAIQRNLDGKTPVRKIMTQKPITVRSEESLSGLLFLMEKFKVSRLPVTSRGKLVGIITRKDIVSAQSQAIGIKSTTGTKSYIAYQTCSAETGSGRMLSVMADSFNEGNFAIVSSVAKSSGYELELLHVNIVPLEENPSTAITSTERARQSAQKYEESASLLGIPVHTSIRVAHDTASAIAETIVDRDINLFVMRYQSKKGERRADRLIQTVLSNTSCKTLLIGRHYNAESPKDFIVPIAEFLNAELAIDMCKYLILPEAKVTLYRALHSKDDARDSNLDARVESICKEWKATRNCEIEIVEIAANSPAGILMSLKEHAKDSVVVLGLPRKYLVKQINKGLFKRNLNSFDSYSAVILATE